MNILSKIFNLIKSYQHHIFLSFCVVIISVISFNLGQINALQKTSITITGTGQEANIYKATSNLPAYRTGRQPTTNDLKSQNTTPIDKRVVVSKASTTKKYHFVWCPGAKKIKETNKLWFDNESLAQKAGYTLAGNCQ